MVDVFISYRRQDSQQVCEELFRHLTKNLPGLKVFMDVEGIAPGRKWKAELEKEVKKCQVLIVLMGPDWISIENDEGIRRITERKDYVRQEISSAIRNHKSIIPILVNGATIPNEVELPYSIKHLTRHQAFRLSDNIEADAMILADRIKVAIKEKKGEDKKRVFSKLIEPIGIVLIIPFFIIYEMFARLLKGASSNIRTIILLLVTMIFCTGCSWVVYRFILSAFFSN